MGQLEGLATSCYNKEMLLLDLTLPTPEENLALDEALLDVAEEANEPVEVLRFWEADRPLVVLGRSSKVAEEAQLEPCKNAGVPVLRRCSGGAAIVAGPGCLMYAVVLSYELHPELRALDLAHRFVLSRLRDALLPLVPVCKSGGRATWPWEKVSFPATASAASGTICSIMARCSMTLMSHCLTSTWDQRRASPPIGRGERIASLLRTSLFPPRR